MKASEALSIIGGLDPDQEVTLVVHPLPKKITNLYRRDWVIDKDQWPNSFPSEYPFPRTVNDIIH